jgi:hypothetical protein
MKQGRGDNYIPVTLTSLNSGWHMGGSICGTPRVRAPGIHRELHRGVAEELIGRLGEDGAGEDAQGSLGGAATSPSSWVTLAEVLG